MTFETGSETKDPTLHLPRILCLHGGGVNASVFRIQCRVLIWHLRHKFRLCFAEAPFLSGPGPGALPAFAGCEPFRRWMRWLPEHPELNSQTIIDEIDYSLRTVMEEDDREGATGDWVGLLGFSQGAKTCASLLFRQQVLAEKLGKDKAGSNYRFGVLFAGRAPLTSLDSALDGISGLEEASSISIYSSNPRGPEDQYMLHIPTVHVHGLQDHGLCFHRQLLHQYCKEGTTRLVEWDGDHRLPINSNDVSAVVEQILAVAMQTGVLND